MIQMKRSTLSVVAKELDYYRHGRDVSGYSGLLTGLVTKHIRLP